jgi:hypothetical protein
MTKAVTIRIQGHGADTDAPTASDWLDQIRDYLDLLRHVEEALSEDGQNAIDWRITNASKNSPITVEMAPYPKQYAVNIDRRADAVITRTATGLRDLQRLPQRPPFFNDYALAKAEKIFARVTNGLDLTETSFGLGLPDLVITPVGARSAATNARIAQKPSEKPYRELGTAEGFFATVGRDGHGHRLLWIRHRLTGNVIKCQLAGQALLKVGEHVIGEVFKGRRLLVSGTIFYKSVGNIAQIHADDIKFFPPRADLPTTDDILDEDFTGGMTSEEYLAMLRDGQHS